MSPRPVAKTISPATVLPAVGLPSSPLIHWFPPDEEIDMVLAGSCGSAVKDLSRELRRVDCFLRAGIDPPTRVLFSGPSGTGKTLAARWLARRLDVDLAVVDVGSIISKWSGESSNNLRDCFAAVGQVDGAVLFLDEIDAICAKRENLTQSKSSAGADLARVTTVFFQQMDWLPPNRIVLAATNFAAELDPALRRRLTTHVVFEPPDREGRRRMLEQWLGRSPILPEQLEALADSADGVAGAELRALAMAMGRRAVMALPEPPRKLQAVEPKAQAMLPAVPDVVLHRMERPAYQTYVPRPREPERDPNGVEKLANILQMLGTGGKPK